MKLKMPHIFHAVTTAFYHLKIRYKLALSYFLVTIIPVVAISYISYTSTLQYVQSQNTVTISSTQQQYDINITNRLKSIVNLAQSINLNRSIQDYLFSNTSTSYLEYSFTSDFLTPFLTALLQSTGAGIHLDVVHYNNLYSDIMNNYVHDTADSAAPKRLDSQILPGRATFNIYKVARVADKEWFRYIEKNVNDYMWLQIEDDAKYDNITLAKPLYNFLYTVDHPVGYLIITVKLQDIIENAPNTGDNTDITHLVFDAHGKLLSVDPDKRAFYQKHKGELTPYILGGETGKSIFLKDYVLMKGVNAINGWNIVTVAPIKRMNENIEKIRNATLLYGMIALIILFIVTNLLAASFSNRIIGITRRMQKVQSNNLNHKVSDPYNDEIGFLARTFNEMTERMENLIRDNYQANIDKKEAQLKALQAQINPHFLYNSLSSISRLGDIGDKERIKTMVRALTTFYRMTLNKGNDLIKISDELEQVKAYTQIYKIRKGDDFNICYKIDEAALSFDTVKVILQPFIENVLEHGVYTRETPINIILSVALQEQDVVFEIIDDGVGIPPKKLNTLLSAKREHTSGYGIKNVDDRIKLQFGAGYGVNIFSRVGIGTKVTLRIPQFKRQQEINRGN